MKRNETSGWNQINTEGGKIDSTVLDELNDVLIMSKKIDKAGFTLPYPAQPFSEPPKAIPGRNAISQLPNSRLKYTPQGAAPRAQFS